VIVEQRTYTLPHGGTEPYLARYEEKGLPLQMRHLGRLLGFFVTEIGPLNQVVHLWAYDSHADREARRAALEADPAWQEFRRGNVGTFVAQETRILRATRFSPRLV